MRVGRERGDFSGYLSLLIRLNEVGVSGKCSEVLSKIPLFLLF